MDTPKRPYKRTLERLRDRAKQWLRTLLSSGPLPATDVIERGRAEGYGRTLLHAARRELASEINVNLAHGPAPRRWMWSLREIQPTEK